MLNATERAARDAIVNKLVPCINSGAPFILLDAPPRVIGPNKVIERPGSILPLEMFHQNEPIGAVNHQFWFSEHLNSKNMPYMGIVVEGNAEMMVGTTAETCARLGIPGKRWIVSLPENSILLAPPHVAFSDGSLPHWYQDHPEKAYAKILWIEFQHKGACCHFSTTKNGKLWTHPYCFFNNENFILLAGDIIREMHGQKEQYVPLVYSYLRVLGYLLARSTSQSSQAPDNAIAAEFEEITTENELIRKAVEYIDANLASFELNVEHLAEQMGASTRHLTRLFQKELGIPAKEFIINRRMALARQLLVASSYTVKVVGWRCGYARSATFIHAFTLKHGEAPSEYRRKHKPMSENY